LVQTLLGKLLAPCQLLLLLLAWQSCVLTHDLPRLLLLTLPLLKPPLSQLRGRGLLLYLHPQVLQVPPQQV
jgi:hypothetical protein